MQQAVGVGLVAEETGEQKRRVVRRAGDVEPVVDLPERGVADPLNDFCRVVGQRQGAAGGVVVIGNGLGGGTAAVGLTQHHSNFG